MSFIERPPMISPVPAEVQKALARLDQPGRKADVKNPKEKGASKHSSFKQEQAFEPGKIIFERNSGHTNLRESNKSTGGNYSEKTNEYLENTQKAIGFIELIGGDFEEISNLNSSDGVSEKVQNRIVSQTFETLKSEKGMENLGSLIRKLNSGKLEKLADAKANAFEEMGLGLFRENVASSELVPLAKNLIREISIDIKQNSQNPEQLKEIIENRFKSLKDVDEVDPKTLASLGIIVGIGSLARSKLKKKDVATALLATSMILSSCYPGYAPTIEAGETEKTLPGPIVNVTPGTPESGLIFPTPTTESGVGNFGLATPTSEWPGDGVNIVTFANNLYASGELREATSVNEGSDAWTSLINQGADVEGLNQAIKDVLQKNGKTAALQLVVDESGGWAFEIKDQDGKMYWSAETDEDGSTNWQSHPNRIIDETQFQELDPERLGLKDGEHLELSIHEGTAIGVVVDSSSQIKGMFDSENNTIVRFVELVVEPTPEPTVDTETFLQQGRELPGVIGVEMRNGEYRAVDKQGLSIFALRDGAWVEVPKVEVDINDPEIRLYRRDSGSGRKALPFGIYYAPGTAETLPDPAPGVQKLLLSGILLEDPWLEEGDNRLVFPVGIPNGNGFTVVNFTDTSVNYDTYDPATGVLQYTWAQNKKNSPGYNLYDGKYSFLEMDKVLEGYERNVGQQIAFRILYSDNPKTLLEYSLTLDKNCYGLEYCLNTRKIKREQIPEAVEIVKAIKSGNIPGYDGKRLDIELSGIFRPDV